MIAHADRQPIVVADAGPLIRLAAAGLLDTLRGLNRRIVLVDRIEDEVIGDASKPFAPEIAAWLAALGEAVQRVETVTGIGVQALRARPAAPERDALLKSALRNSGEQALREFVGRWQPTETASAVVLYEDRKVATLFLDVDFPVTLMTTRAFAATVSRWGVNADAVAALESIADRYDPKPALVGEIDPDMPVDLRTLPAPMRES
ncbi:hypothetical protein Q8W71_08195 [Methylobacterium sp. NEAU 140]|uniref:hypothetical protein n=1 Tax=Methylobacterium sp. NEAU 140 TaxID=3064945 RepID=UPI002734232E|nr:hypothetical protein [Methylobacterium sp. NEAU 140]MDP4022598.1 hypothetical protein [Methylobacterium sp. NEAU 140]